VLTTVKLSIGVTRKVLRRFALRRLETCHTPRINWRAGCALILGPESTGLTLKEIAAAKMTVRIPMLGTVESLNVSVAAGILLYEAARQRGFKD
jgi:tRNA G18 (ribose-2'-O)-methylase SpoU